MAHDVDSGIVLLRALNIDHPSDLQEKKSSKQKLDFSLYSTSDYLNLFNLFSPFYELIFMIFVFKQAVGTITNNLLPQRKESGGGGWGGMDVYKVCFNFALFLFVFL